MAEKLKGLFGEVQGEMFKVNLIYTFLDSLMLFFIAYFIASLFDIKFIYTLAIPGAIAFIFFLINFSIRLRNSKLKDMEDANPQLREILRTAHDNQDQDNFMVKALFEELKGKLRTASSGKLLDSKKITTRVISAIAIVFLIVILSSITINLKKIDIPFDKLNFLKDGNETRTEGEVTSLVFNETDVIYGDANIAKLGNDALNIQVDAAKNTADLDNTGDAEENELNSGAIPQEIKSNSDAYSNQAVLEEAEAAVNYSQRINKIQ
jgi:hypothetical protein